MNFMRFMILPDERISLYKDLDYSVPGFRQKEPFEYMVVSMELAENMLRRQLYGIRFVPVKINWKERNVCENKNS